MLAARRFYIPIGRVAMDDESVWRRTTPERSYRPGEAVHVVPISAWEETLQLFQRAGRREMVCFWYGERQGDGGRVRAILVPRQKQSRGNYHVDASAMLKITEAVRPFGWKNLSQLHSHPGAGVEHSLYDD